MSSDGRGGASAATERPAGSATADGVRIGCGQEYLLRLDSEADREVDHAPFQSFVVDSRATCRRVRPDVLWTVAVAEVEVETSVQSCSEPGTLTGAYWHAQWRHPRVIHRQSPSHAAVRKGGIIPHESGEPGPQVGQVK